MKRDYAEWNQLKVAINERPLIANFSEREVWWCSIGVNVGFEEDGKNKLYERPVLILKKFSKQLFIGVPLSTAHKKSRFYHDIAVGDKDGVVLLSQARVFAAERLQRRMGRVTSDEFVSIALGYQKFSVAYTKNRTLI